jgi:hypothetical protein
MGIKRRIEKLEQAGAGRDDSELRRRLEAARARLLMDATDEERAAYLERWSRPIPPTSGGLADRLAAARTRLLAE